MNRLTPATVAHNATWWLLDLWFAGRWWRLTDAPTGLTVTSTTDGDLVYDAALTDVSATLGSGDPGNPTATAASASLDILWPDDFAALVAQGFDPTTMRGSLSRWVDGDRKSTRLNSSHT